MKISDHCYAITGLGFTPPWEVNAGLVAGERHTLVVDTGPSELAARTILGYATSVRPGNRLVAVNTELHLDHLLGNSLFRERSVPIWGHARCEREADALAAAVEELNATIPDDERRLHREAGVFFGGSAVANPDRRISGEHVLDLGGLTAVLRPAPGHTVANLLVHVPADGVLFSGDTVVTGYRPNLASGGRAEWLQWLDALDAIRRLAPRVLVPGHGPVVEGDQIEPAIARIEGFLREALR